MNKFTDGTTEGYAELPVPAAWLSWTRGNTQLISLKDTDPGNFLGGWRAFVMGKDRSTDEEFENPKLPLPIVERMSQDGKFSYNVYATNVISFLPIQYRMRFELKEKTVDPQTGREYQKTVATSDSKQPGWNPNKQIFGLVYNGDEFAPAVLILNKWSAFISFEKAGQKWNKVKIGDNQALVRRYGTVGVVDAKGKTMPKFEEFGQGRSTPIDAVGIDKPMIVEITPYMDDLHKQSIAWKNCPMWNKIGEVVEDPQVDTPMTKFLSACDDLGLTNVEIEQLVKENQGNYVAALKAVTGQFDIDNINAELAEGDIHDELPY